MKFPARTVLVVLLVLFGLLCFYRLGSWGVLETSEARYAEMGREMYLSGDYLHPTFTGLRHYHKPPFTYAITALAYRLFGVSAWSARIFLQLALLVQLWQVYRIGRLLLRRERTALWATAVYASFPVLLMAANNLTTDLYLTTFLLAGVWAFLRSERGGGRLSWLLLTYGFWGLAALTKGAGVVVLPAILLPAWYLLYPPVSWWRTFGRHAAGAVLFLLIGLSWYAALIYEDRSLFDYFLIEQTVHRYTSDQWMRAKPAWFYLATVGGTTLPWTLALIGFGKRWGDLKEERKPLIWFAAWVIGTILFYSFAQSKLILYVLPAYAGIALLAGLWLEHASERAVSRWWLASRLLFTLLLTVLLAAPWVHPELEGSIPYTLWLILALPLVWWLPGTLTRTAGNGAERLLVTCLLFTVSLLPIGREFLALNELLANSPAPLADRLRAAGLADHEVYMVNRELPGLAFHLQTPMVRLYEGDMPRDTSRQVDERWRARWNDVSRPAVLDSLARRWSTTATVVVTADPPSEELAPWLAALGFTDRVGRYYVFYNFPPKY